MESDNESFDSMSSFDDWYDRIQYLPEWNPLSRIEDYDMESRGTWKIIQEENMGEVMAGNISISDHTALSCVHERMIRMRNIARPSKIRRFIDKMAYFIKNFEAVFQLHHLHLQQDERERPEARG